MNFEKGANYCNLAFINFNFLSGCGGPGEDALHNVRGCGHV